MAEEKNKKFCTKCGKELKEGEVCDCSSSNGTITVNINKDAIVSSLKHFASTVLNMFTKPSTTIKEETENAKFSDTILLLVARGIAFGLMMMGLFKTMGDSIIGLFDAIGSSAGFDFGSLIDIPYFKIFMYMFLINIIVAFIVAGLSVAAGKIVGSKNITYKKALSLYATSKAPTILGSLFLALLYLIGILGGFATFIGLVISLICTMHFVYGFKDLLKVNENKVSYATTGLMIIWDFIVMLFMFFAFSGIVSDVGRSARDQIEDDYNDTINDVFNW